MGADPLFLQKLAIAKQKREACPIDYALRRLTDPQRAWLSMTARIAIWRGGNQLGKSWGMAVDMVSFARGQHPWQKQEPRHKPPVRILVVSYSWDQMDPLLEKVWTLLPKGEVDPALDYRPGRGLIGRKEKVIEFISGPGKGSVIVFATYKQGSERIAGGTFHRAYMDEPCPEEIFSEVRPRLNKFRGHMRISFTPTLKTAMSAPVDYLRKKLEDGPAEEIAELHTELNEKSVTIRSNVIDLPLLPQSEIDAFERDCLEVERDMRMKGSWEPITLGRWLSTFGDHNITRERPPAKARLCVAYDWGLGSGNQYAALIAVMQTGDLIPDVWLWDEVAIEDDTTIEVDAQNTVMMLRRNGLKYEHIDLWVGDTPTGKNRRGQSKTNQDMRKHLAVAFQVKRSMTKYIETPYDKGAASELRGLRLMKSVMGQKTTAGVGRFRVHPRCKKFIQSALNYKGGKWSEHKHAIDGVRYGFEKLVEVGNWVNIRAVYS